MRRRDLIAAALGAAVATALAGSVAWAAIPGPGGMIQGCYDSGGNLKVVEALPCPKGYTQLPWNQQGSQGIQGPKGDTGDQGAPGEPGAMGPAGPALGQTRSVVRSASSDSSYDAVISVSDLGSLQWRCLAGSIAGPSVSWQWSPLSNTRSDLTFPTVGDIPETFTAWRTTASAKAVTVHVVTHDDSTGCRIDAMTLEY